MSSRRILLEVLISLAVVIVAHVVLRSGVGDVFLPRRSDALRPPRVEAAPPRTVSVESDPDVNPEASEMASLRQQIAELTVERDVRRNENAVLSEENATLRRDRADLQESVTELSASQDDSESRADEFARLQAEFLAQQDALTAQIELLRHRLESIPACTAWGYMSMPSPRMIPESRRIVIVSDARGRIFRTPRECERVRRLDPAAVSRCDCAGPVP